MPILRLLFQLKKLMTYPQMLKVYTDTFMLVRSYTSVEVALGKDANLLKEEVGRMIKLNTPI